MVGLDISSRTPNATRVYFNNPIQQKESGVAGGLTVFNRLN
jgi:hypothetical protein